MKRWSFFCIFFLNFFVLSLKSSIVFLWKAISMDFISATQMQIEKLFARELEHITKGVCCYSGVLKIEKF